MNSGITSYIQIQNLPHFAYGFKYIKEYNLVGCFSAMLNLEVFNKIVKNQPHYRPGQALSVPGAGGS
jgi:hypothetical protein